jgi:hypothetical protein
MQSRSLLSRADYEEYLITLYFGSGADQFTNCLDRAYRDFSRTLRGLRMVETKSNLYVQARNDLHEHISSLIHPRNEITDQRSFDHWHQLLCKHLALCYAEHGHHLYVGQAQKWINMAFKYIFTLGEQRLPGFGHLYPFCHVPLDNILIAQMLPYGSPQLTGRWSRLDSYDEYLAYQVWVRQRFSILPLDVEFFLWLGKPVPGLNQENSLR